MRQQLKYFIVTDKHIITPPLSSGCVNGIIRTKVVENASNWGYSMEEKKTLRHLILLKQMRVF